MWIWLSLDAVAVMWLQLQEKEDEYRANLQAVYRQVSQLSSLFIAVPCSGMISEMHRSSLCHSSRPRSTS